MWPSGNEELISKATELSEKYIVNVVQDISERYHIDERPHEMCSQKSH